MATVMSVAAVCPETKPTVLGAPQHAGSTDCGVLGVILNYGLSAFVQNRVPPSTSGFIS